jgi:CheY-like chemotaxis protein
MMSSRILVADGNPLLLEAFVEMLQGKFTVAGTLPDATSVLNHFHDLKPDLIVSDILFGDMTGFEMVRRLRQKGCSAKMIFLTAQCRGLTDVVVKFSCNSSALILLCAHQASG